MIHEFQHTSCPINQCECTLSARVGPPFDGGHLPPAQHFRAPWIAQWALLVVLAVCSALLPARAGVANAPGANLEVALVTYGPGEVYWERFGHDAIEVRDTASGEALNFNYGLFDFNQKDFFLTSLDEAGQKVGRKFEVRLAVVRPSGAANYFTAASPADRQTYFTRLIPVVRRPARRAPSPR